MLSHFLKCRKNTKSKNLEVAKSVQCVIVENQNLLKNKNLENY